MAKLRGTGIAAVNYPTGMNLGGDPSQALVHATTSGSFVVIAVGHRPRPGPEDRHRPDRGRDARRRVRGGRRRHRRHRHRPARHGHVRQPGHPPRRATRSSRPPSRPARRCSRSRPRSSRRRPTISRPTARATCWSGASRPGRCKVADIAALAQFKYGKTIAGRGSYMKPKSEVDPETGAMDPDSTEAHACTVAEVEVDTETGEVTVLSIRSAYEVGRQVNPALVQGQIVGRRLDGACRTPCTRRPRPTTRRPITPRRTSAST